MGKMHQQTCEVMLLLVGFVVVAQATAAVSSAASTEMTASVTQTSNITTATSNNPPASTTSGTSSSAAASQDGTATTNTHSNSPTSISGSASPVTSAPTGSSNAAGSSGSSAGSTTVAPNQCYNHTCHSTGSTCLKDKINSNSSSIGKCPRGNKYCKITRTLKNNTYTIVAECVNDSCELSDTSSDANGKVTFNCCQSHLCNTEEILNSAGGTLHAYLPVTLVAVVALTSLV